MSFNIQVRRGAEVDVAEAQLWYETQLTGLGSDFLYGILTRNRIAFRKLPSSTKLYTATFVGHWFGGIRLLFGIKFDVMK